MQSPSSAPPAALDPRQVLGRLLPIALLVFFVFLTVGIPLPVLPLYVHGQLGYGALAVGAVIGCQSLAALLTRAHAGQLADRSGAGVAVRRGLCLIAAAGGCYLLSLWAASRPPLALALLLIGRALLGAGESLAGTGLLSWGLGRVGLPNAGRVMAWVGIAMYGALALGAPLGMLLQQAWGFAAMALTLLLLPAAALALMATIPPVAPPPGVREPFYRVLGAVWQPGVGLALAAVGFGAIASFVTLYFAQRGWSHASAALTAFGAAYIGARLCFAGLPDQLGGARIALACLAIEAAGQLLLWSADGQAAALAGAALTGLGFSLVFPAFGVEAVKRVAPASRGSALGAYAAFFDLALGLAGPLAGVVALGFGYAAVYLFGALAVLAALPIALRLLFDQRAQASSMALGGTK
ncbi:MFS transporter [Chitinimonas koreensis]|uniref:MFS transporter n=1 Tax=Chitinimonas koreensis TaxID=356302 RepID=UPI0003F99E83|nr:MFS transporter [Chitinimonas koreensis]QNM96953.1 arabinose transporter [Chitinimonas koreensis]